MVLLVWTSIPSGGLLRMQQERAAEGASDSTGESIKKKKNNITVMVNYRRGDQHHACSPLMASIVQSKAKQALHNL